jgi:aminopeptidase-like protein
MNLSIAKNSQPMTRDERGNLIKDIVEKLYPFNYSVTGAGSAAAIDAFCKLASFSISSFGSGSETRGWVIPTGWEVLEAKITHQGQLLFDCLSHSPLGCAYLSPSFQGIVDKEELLKHCAWREG